MTDSDPAGIFRGNHVITAKQTSAPASANSPPYHHDHCSTLNFTSIHDTLKHLLSPPSEYSSPDLKITHDERTEKPPLNVPQLSLLNKHSKLRETNSSLFFDEDDRMHLQSPLHSMGFRRPSRIQERALPQLLAYPPRNMIAQSQNGTGKTAAFSLATLSRIDRNLNHVQALVLAPTFELAIQIGHVMETMAKYLPHIRIAYAVRDPTISKRRELVKGQELNASIVIGTPGTVEDWCQKMKVINLKKLRVFVVDEADVMISLPGFSQICIDLVKNTIGKDCQTMLFSATYSDEVMDFAKRVIENPIIFRLKREEQSLSNIRQFYIQCRNDAEKYDAVKMIYSSITIGQAMIFCRSKRTAHHLALQMINDKHCVELLSSELTVEQRASVINRFREGKFRVLVVTNVCARGIDIDDISLVVNFEFPLVYDDRQHSFIAKPDYDTYLHRIGRAGRFGRTGHTFNLVTPSEMPLIADVENYFQKPIVEFSEKFFHDDDLI